VRFDLPNPARRSLGHPGRPVHPPARPTPTRRGPGTHRAGRRFAVGRRHHPAAGRGAGSGRDCRCCCPRGPDGASGRPANRPAAGAGRAAALTDPPAAAAHAAPARTGTAMTALTLPRLGGSWPPPAYRHHDPRPPRWPRAGTGLACGAARGNPAPARGPAGCLLDGLPPRPLRGQGSLRAPECSLGPAGRPLTAPGPRRPGATRSPGAGEEPVPDQQAPPNHQKGGRHAGMRLPDRRPGRPVHRRLPAHRRHQLTPRPARR
jgi:hypothetical protein